MTADEIRSKIEFRQYDTGKYFAVVAEISFSAEQRLLCTGYKDTAIDNAKEDLREIILRNIFDDQRKELYEAMEELLLSLHCLPPFGGEKFFAAKDRLMKAANYQPEK